MKNFEEPIDTSSETAVDLFACLTAIMMVLTTLFFQEFKPKSDTKDSEIKTIFTFDINENLNSFIEDNKLKEKRFKQLSPFRVIIYGSNKFDGNKEPQKDKLTKKPMIDELNYIEKILNSKKNIRVEDLKRFNNHSTHLDIYGFSQKSDSLDIIRHGLIFGEMRSEEFISKWVKSKILDIEVDSTQTNTKDNFDSLIRLFCNADKNCHYSRYIKQNSTQDISPYELNYDSCRGIELAKGNVGTFSINLNGKKLEIKRKTWMKSTEPLELKDIISCVNDFVYERNEKNQVTKDYYEFDVIHINSKSSIKATSHSCIEIDNEHLKVESEC